MFQMGFARGSASVLWLVLCTSILAGCTVLSDEELEETRRTSYQQGWLDAEANLDPLLDELTSKSVVAEDRAVASERRVKLLESNLRQIINRDICYENADTSGRVLLRPKCPPTRSVPTS